MAKKKSTAEFLPLTTPVEEGPYYKEGSPERRVIVERETPGSRLVMEGRVLDSKGKPIVHAWLDFWSADGRGIYDNEGYNLRGHQYTDKEGHYHLETVRPHEYMMRSPHLHVKVRASEDSPILTSQLFFPGEQTNATDYLFEGSTVVDIEDIEGGQKAHFDFIVDT
jgi:protocatechuate 3,4-dioxygenase beta subunit